MKLLYDVGNGKWYNESGESFRSGNPAIPYGNAERVEIQLYSEVVGANTGSTAVSDWIKYTGFSGSGYGALLATDNNFLHWYKATLKNDVSSGSLSDPIDVTTSQSIENIAESGNIYLYSDGETEAVAYSSCEAISGGIRFTPTAGNTLDNAYATGDQADIPEMLYAEAAMVAAASDPSSGLFVFDFVCDSTKLRNKMQYSSVEKIDDCKGLEITIFQTENNIVSIRKRFRCTTFSITGGIADIQTGVSVPTPVENQILVLLNSYLSNGLEVQCSENGSIWIDYEEIEDFQAVHWYRFRIKYSGAAWSNPIPMIAGPQGETGETGPQGPQGIQGPRGNDAPLNHTHVFADITDRSAMYATDTEATGGTGTAAKMYTPVQLKNVVKTHYAELSKRASTGGIQLTAGVAFTATSKGRLRVVAVVNSTYNTYRIMINGSVSFYLSSQQTISLYTEIQNISSGDVIVFSDTNGGTELYPSAALYFYPNNY